MQEVTACVPYNQIASCVPKGKDPQKRWPAASRRVRAVLGFPSRMLGSTAYIGMGRFSLYIGAKNAFTCNSGGGGEEHCRLTCGKNPIFFFKWPYIQAKQQRHLQIKEGHTTPSCFMFFVTEIPLDLFDVCYQIPWIHKGGDRFELLEHRNLPRMVGSGRSAWTVNNVLLNFREEYK